MSEKKKVETSDYHSCVHSKRKHFFDSVMTGDLKESTSFYHVIVLAETWPSWAYSLGGLFGNINMYVATKEDVGVKRLWFGSTVIWWSWFDLKSNWKKIQEEDGKLVCIQGDCEFVKSLVKGVIETDDNSTYVIAMDASGASDDIWIKDKRLESRYVSHWQCGGVTKDKWRIMILHNGEDLIWSRKQDVTRSFGGSIRRSLGHIIDTTQSGTASIPKNYSSPVFKEDDVIPRRFLMNCIINVPTVFKKDTLIFRKLTRREIFNMKDLPVSMEGKIGRSISSNTLKSIINAAPSKILWEVLRFYFTSNVVNHERLQFKTIEDNISTITKSFEQLLRDVKVSDNDSSDDPEEVTPEGIAMKAVKADDAEAEDRIWNENVFDAFPWIRYNHTLHAPLLDRIRRLMLRWYYISVRKSFVHYLKTEYGSDVCVRIAMKRHKSTSMKRKRTSSKNIELNKDLVAGRDAISRCCKSTFWEWDHGSRLLFWRWPKAFRKEARDGTRVFVKSALPRYTKRQKWPRSETDRSAMLEKLQKVQRRGYVSSGHVSSLTNYFCVPKGSDDIRMVYDATKCGLNDAVWAPNFGLPTVDSSLRAVEITTWSGDIDLGEMFLNYMIDENLRPFMGIDVTECLNDDDDKGHKMKARGKRVWYRWDRCMMGFKPCPYNSIKACSFSEDVIRGDMKQSDSPFHWDVIVLNLPGNTNYNPLFPWVYKWNSKFKCVAGEIFIYVDDIRPTGRDSKHCTQVMRRTASYSNYLGQQDAARKRRVPSQSPGLWSGSLVKTDNENVYVSTSQAKWNKGRSIVFDWIAQYVTHDVSSASTEPSFDYKSMEKGRGFLVHLGTTYPWIMTRLKGVHHTLESWRGRRDLDGWKLKDDEWDTICNEARRSDSDVLWPKPSHNGLVVAVKRLRWDLLALGNLLSDTTPPLRLVRGRKLMIVKYGFGDASGSGFGTSWQDGDNGISYRHGVWGKDTSSRSSNFRELKNLVDSLESMSHSEDLCGVELFLFTDNVVAESAFYKGTSSSPLLFQLILRLIMLEKLNQMRIHLIHVAGTRMVAQGSDGLSRGNMLEGVMSGMSMLSFVPLNKSALEVQTNLEDWLKSWLPNHQDIELLSPSDWFVRGHDVAGYELNSDGIEIPSYRDGTFIWAPPPAAADVAIEQLRKARHKRQKSLHVFVCPRLMKPVWYKQACKTADILFEIKPTHLFWSAEQHEPLIILICFPFLRFDPWQLRNSSPLLEVGRILRQVSKEGEATIGFILRELCLFTRRLHPMPQGMVRQMLHSGYQNHLSYQKCRE